MHLRSQTAETLAEAFPGLPLAVARRVLHRVVGEDRDDLAGVRGLSKACAAELRERGRLDRLEVVDRRRSAVDPFVKYLFRSTDGRVFEAVRIPLEKPRWSVCLSSQVGCALGCAFCETGRLGFLRNLEPWEMVEQALTVRRESPERPLTGVVFQGQGEPFQNYDNVIRAARILRDPSGPRIGSDRITISTVGLLPQIERYTDEGHPYRLILSLTSAFSEKRARLVPVTARYGVPELAAAMRRHAASPRRAGEPRLGPHLRVQHGRGGSERARAPLPRRVGAALGDRRQRPGRGLPCGPPTRSAGASSRPWPTTGSASCAATPGAPTSTRPAACWPRAPRGGAAHEPPAAPASVSPRILPAADPLAIAEAAAVLRAGGLVAFPTETVYGLGADAFDPRAVARVFEVKARPSFDPLIVHLASAATWLGSRRPTTRASAPSPRASGPARSRWSLPRRPEVPDLVTSGLDTVGVRVPAHPAAHALIAAAGTPVAAPSANPFGYVSPTTAAHVAELLGARGGPRARRRALPCRRRVHDPVAGRAAAVDPAPRRRPARGARGRARACPWSWPARRSVRSRLGSSSRHYATRTPLRILAGPGRRPPRGPRPRGAPGVRPGRRAAAGYAVVEVLAPDASPATAAANLFAALRRLDARGPRPHPRRALRRGGPRPRDHGPAATGRGPRTRASAGRRRPRGGVDRPAQPRLDVGAGAT